MRLRLQLIYINIDHSGTGMLMKELASPFKTPEGLKRPEAAILIFFLGFVLTANERKKLLAGIEIQRHTECAYYFKRRRLFCLVFNEPEVQATDK